MAGKLISDLDPIASIIDTTLTEVEDASVSYKATYLQILNYLISKGGCAPPGAIMEYAGASAPTGWLLCNGQAVSRITYASLFSSIGEAWGVGDGSTTFNVPDMREASPYGVGTRASGVTAHDAFTLGQFKDDQMQGHLHNYMVWSNNPAEVDESNQEQVADYISPAQYTTSAPVEDVANGHGVPRTGTTTRGKLIGVNFIIKY